MQNNHPWILLGIEPTRDETEIRRAYARQLKKYRPDEDPEGFQRLVAARNAALNWTGPLPGEQEASTGEDAEEFEDGDGDDEDAVGEDDTDAGDGEPNRAPPPVRLVPMPELVVVPRAEEGGMPDPPPSANAELPPPSEEEASEGPDPEEPEPEEPQEPASQESPAGPTVEERAHALLRQLLGLAPSDGRPGPRTVTWEVAAWEPLFKLADQLSLDARNRFRDTFVTEFFRRLPAPNRHEEGLYDFTIGFGIAAVVERIDAEFQLTRDQTEVARRYGPAPVHVYMKWIATAAEARGVLNRPTQGRRAYWREDGLPLFFGRDHEFAIPARLSAWLGKSFNAGRWLRNFKPYALLTPGAVAAQLGLAPIGALFVLLNAAWLFVSNVSSRTDVLIAGAALLALGGLRVAAAFLLPRLAIIMAMARIRNADKRRIWGDERRYIALRPQNTDRTVYLLGMGDIATLAIVAGVIISVLIPAWRISEVRNQPREQLWSQLVQSVLDDGASQDRRDTQTFVNIFDKLASQRGAVVPPPVATDGGGRSLPIAADRRGQDNWGPYLIVRADVDRYLAAGLYSTSMTAAIARTAKLGVLAERYRQSSPTDRLALEKELAAWLPLLEEARDPEDEAAVWAAIPPRTQGPALEHYPGFVRKLALLSLLRDNGDVERSPELTTSDTAMRVLATTTDRDYYLGLRPDFLENLSATIMTNRDGDVVPPSRYFQESVGRPVPVVANTEANAWVPYQLARHAFYEMAAVCLAATRNPAIIQNLENTIADTIGTLPSPITTSSDSWWRGRSARLVQENACFQAVTSDAGNYRQGSSGYSYPSPGRADLQTNGMLELARELLQAHRYDDARDTYDGYLDLVAGQDTATGREVAFAGLAQIALQRGDAWEALTELDRVGGEGQGYNGFRAAALYGLGEDRRALPYADKAVVDQDQTARLLRAEIRSRLGDYPGAAEDVSDFLAAHPDHPLAKALLDRIVAAAGAHAAPPSETQAQAIPEQK